MRIRLHFPTASIEAVKAMGLSQRNPETLRWTNQHSSSSYGLGVILRGKSGEILDGKSFAALVTAFGAWIECDDAETKRRVEHALVTIAPGLDDSIRIESA